MIRIFRTAVGAIIASMIYIFATVWFFKNAAKYFLFAGAALLVLLMIFNYGRAILDVMLKDLPSARQENPVPPEPAFKSYYHRQAYRDCYLIFIKAWEYNYEHSRDIFKWNASIIDSPIWFITWPFGVIVFGILAVSLPAIALFFVCFGLLHLLTVATVCSFANISGMYLRSIEWLSGLWRQAAYVCPHAECYQPINLPHYRCPNCGAVHKKLVPGSYGILARRCACEKQMLPTLAFIGRNKLDAQCPHCERLLNSAIGSAANIHLPIVGGPSVGKTNYLIASLMEMEKDSRRSGRKLTFPDKNDQRTYYRNKQMFLRGEPALKTTALSPKSLMVKISEPNGVSNLVHLYDAAGELFSDAGDLRRLQKYYAYSDGILFLIDPFSLRQVQVDYADRIAEVQQELQPSNENPQDVYDRMVSALKNFYANSSSPRKMPITIVLTKIDAFDLIEQLGIRLYNGQFQDVATISYKIRQWLIDKGEGNLVRSIERDFDNVRFYCCSSLGHLPNGMRFRPLNILPPIQWILNKRSVDISGRIRKSIGWKNEKIAYSLASAAATFVFAVMMLSVGITGKALKSRLAVSPQIASIAPPKMQKPTVYVNTRKQLNLRNHPGTKRTQVLEKLTRGTKLTVLEIKTENAQKGIRWYRVETEAGNIGWVASGKNDAYLSPAPIN